MLQRERWVVEGGIRNRKIGVIPIKIFEMSTPTLMTMAIRRKVDEHDLERDVIVPSTSHKSEFDEIVDRFLPCIFVSRIKN